MLDTYIVPLHLKNKVKQIGFREIDYDRNQVKTRKLFFWRIIALIGWGAFFITILLSSCNKDPVWASEITPLSIAQSQIGLGEIGGNNKGIYVRQYLNGRENLPWCAGFVSYCIKKAGYSLPYFLKAKSYLEIGKKIARWNLSSNDIVIFSRQGGGHIGIVEQVVNNGFVSIEGNLGDYPAKVKRVNHIFEDRGILGFVRLARRIK